MSLLHTNSAARANMEDYVELFRLAANYIYDQAIEPACPAHETYFIYTIIREAALYIKNCGPPTEKLKAKCYELSKLTETQCTGRLNNVIMINDKKYYSAQSIATLVFICSLDVESSVPAEHYGAECAFEVCSNAGHYVNLIDMIYKAGLVIEGTVCTGITTPKTNSLGTDVPSSTLDRIADDLLKKSQELDNS